MLVTGQLEQAVATFNEALKEWTRERAPLQWAATQNNLGTAFAMLGRLDKDTGRLEQALAAFRESVATCKEVVAGHPGNIELQRALQSGVGRIGFLAFDFVLALARCPAGGRHFHRCRLARSGIMGFW